MTQIEIATKIFCAGQAESIQDAWDSAGTLLSFQAGISEDLSAITERTSKRTQQVIDLGFEYNVANEFFEKDWLRINASSIEKDTEEEWEETINNVLGIHIEEPIDATVATVDPVPDIFDGSPYIEFELANTICRLYRQDNKIEAEKDLQINKKTEKGFIIAHSDNEQLKLGITIFKK